LKLLWPTDAIKNTHEVNSVVILSKDVKPTKVTEIWAVYQWVCQNFI